MLHHDGVAEGEQFEELHGIFILLGSDMGNQGMIYELELLISVAVPAPVHWLTWNRKRFYDFPFSWVYRVFWGLFLQIAEDQTDISFVSTHENSFKSLFRLLFRFYLSSFQWHTLSSSWITCGEKTPQKKKKQPPAKQTFNAKITNPQYSNCQKTKNTLKDSNERF